MEFFGWLWRITLVILLGTFIQCHRSGQGEKSVEQEPEIKLVTAEAAAKRMFCLSLITKRGLNEDTIHQTRQHVPAIVDGLSKDLEPNNQQIVQDMRREGLWEAFSAKGKVLMLKPTGAWTQQECIDAVWRFEARYVMEWALNLQDHILPYDHAAAPEDLKNINPEAMSDKKLIAQAKLRPQSEIAKARDLAELWLWRARTTYFQKKGETANLPGGLTFEKIISMTAEEAEKSGDLKAIRHDFPAFGKAYAELTEEEWSQCLSIATERLYALNWLCGYAKDWDKIPTGT